MARKKEVQEILQAETSQNDELKTEIAGTEVQEAEEKTINTQSHEPPTHETQLKDCQTVIVHNRAHDSYRRAGFRLVKGENQLEVNSEQLAQLQADSRLTVITGGE